ncbi:PadR family transcriptional regulator [Thermogymnomonas acidicola]|uniref:PadR family transcriptional regulator n=1 Tax=Thermogymnomonas acidicola TaxID=399579 RepID=A0AA37BQL9_9ARCH|nr:PadR family transcriptional regulator [Thermogymnomonas acidicola]GGM70822.1 PadR family transcriptional regulator [Thermogymnomonas acidicola]
MYGMRRGMRHHGMFGGLRTMILSMVSSGPKNGAEIINSIDTATMGWWRPSPGSIYPMLSSMVEDGLLQKNSDGRYSLTEKGQAELAARRSIMGSFGPFKKLNSPEEVISEIRSDLEFLMDLGDSLKDRKKDIEDLTEMMKKILSRLE